MLERVHDNTSNSETEHDKLQDVPEGLEVFTLLFLHFLDGTVEEEQSEATIKNLEQDNYDGKPAHVTLQPENLEIRIVSYIIKKKHVLGD